MTNVVDVARMERRARQILAKEGLRLVRARSEHPFRWFEWGGARYRYGVINGRNFLVDIADDDALSLAALIKRWQ